MEIQDSQIDNVGITSGFVNNGGSLLIRNVNATRVEASGAVISVNDETGALILEDFEISDSDVQVRTMHESLNSSRVISFSVGELTQYVFFR